MNNSISNTPLKSKEEHSALLAKIWTKGHTVLKFADDIANSFYGIRYEDRKEREEQVRQLGIRGSVILAEYTVALRWASAEGYVAIPLAFETSDAEDWPFKLVHISALVIQEPQDQA